MYVATPPDSHEFYAAMAAGAGKKVYVEKPMARTYDECRADDRGCAGGGGTKLFVAYYRRACRDS